MTNSEANLVAGIGASAGGVEALKDLFGQMPANSGAAFIVVQHLDPRHTSLMPELLAKNTIMTVHTAADGVRIEANRVYVIPAGMELSIEDNAFVGFKTEAQESRRAKIDHFFISLAEQFQERSLGIVLSGMGSDGTLGLRAIKEYGGMTLVQTPETAKFDSMPRSAILTGVVDFILSVEEIPKKIQDLCEHYERLHHGKSAEQFSGAEQHSLAKIIAGLYQHTGHDFKHYKKSTIVRRVRRRMQVNQVSEFDAYEKLILESRAEAQELFNDLLIGVTHFFRDSDSWQFLAKEIIPDIFQQACEQNNHNPVVRVWVPACATGEEAYSIAMLLQEYMDSTHRHATVKIFATDIDSSSLEVARRGAYPEGIAEYISNERLERFFTREGSLYRVRKNIREMCIFSEHNLVSAPPFSRMHLIACRNLLIYFEQELQKRMFPLFHYSLWPQGYLFLGSSESISNASALFRTVNKACRIFQAKSTLSRKPIELPGVGGGFPGFLAGLADQRLQQRRPSLAGSDKPQFIRVLERIILDKYSAPGCVVNESGNIIYIIGPITEFIHMPSGEPQMNIIEMVHKNIRLVLRTNLHKAFTEKKKIEKDVSFPLGDEIIAFRLIIRPLPEIGENSDLFLVVFSKYLSFKGGQDVQKPQLPSREEREAIEQLEMELKNTREYLETTIEELETSNEELKSSNEELLSMNEELQSSNEEMQTSKEELQSMNEELQTVNAELSKKIEELDTAHSDLQNLYESTQLAILFLDNDLRINGFTPFLQEMFSVIETDVGRPITDIAARFSNQDFASEAKNVLRTLERRIIEVQKPDTHKWFMMQITPYRTVNNQIDGLTVSFVDITQLKQAQVEISGLNQDLEYRLNELETLFHLAPVGLAVSYDSKCRDIRLNRAGAMILGRTEQPAGKRQEYNYWQGNVFYDGNVVVADENQPIQKAARTGEEVTTTEMRVRRENGTDVHIQMSAMPLFDQAQKVRGVIGAFTDISSLRRVQQQLKQVNESLERRVEERSAEAATRAIQLGLATQLLQVEQQERRKLSKVLHDHLQQLLVAAKVRMAKFERSDDAQKVVELLDESIDSAKRLTVQLSPPLTFERGLKSAFKWLVRWAQRELQLRVHLSLRGEDRPCNEEMGFFLFHSTKELLFNIFKHANVNEAWITLTFSRADDLTVEVMDKGKGVTPASSTENQDSGFGLFSIKERIAMIGGTLEVKSAAGKGTNITLFLPASVLQISEKELPRLPNNPVTARPKAENTFVEAPGKVRVMLVDDHALFREGLAWLIEDQPNMAVVGEAQSGKEALDMVEKCSPQVVLMDVSLPDMSGIDVTREIKTRHPDICIIGLSMHEKDYMARELRSVGADAYVLKTEASSELIAAINRLV